MLKNARLSVGFSGGEKKRAEILQMALVLEPSFAFLTRRTPGLDIDALKIVADGVGALRSPDRAVVVITHYQRLLDLYHPGHGPCALQGRGGPVRRQGSLAHELEANGYADIIGADGLIGAERIRR